MNFKRLNKIMQSGKQVNQSKTGGIVTDKALDTAGNIDKETFLTQLLDQWYDIISKKSDVEKEVAKARERIKKSGYEAVFDKVGITDDDLRETIVMIQEAKPEQAVTEKIKINSMCPCGSGKKYKKCCGRFK